MAKKKDDSFPLASCKEVYSRVRAGFQEGVERFEASLDVESAPGAGDVALDGLIGALQTCRSDSTIGWLLEALTRVRAERDKAQVEMFAEEDAEEEVEVEDEEG